jgi:metal-responsive CopG/Arc/MetJ family transcriptional regulator
MKTAISIPDPLFNAVERLAKRLGISRSELFQRAVKEFLGNHKDKGVTEALNEVYGSDRVKARLDPLLERMQVVSIQKEEW